MNTMTAKHFDSLSYVKRAKELGTSEELAEFQARQIEQAIEVAISNIESKELVSKGDIVNLQRELQKELIAVELRVIKWILATGATTILAIAGLLKFMIH